MIIIGPDIESRSICSAINGDGLTGGDVLRLFPRIDGLPEATSGWCAGMILITDVIVKIQCNPFGNSIYGSSFRLKRCPPLCWPRIFPWSEAVSHQIGGRA